jgi:hypothetical protein
LSRSLQLMCPCHQGPSHSREVGQVFRVFVPTALATSLVCRPLPDLGLAADLRGFRSVDVSGKIALFGRSSLDLSLPFRARLHRRRRVQARLACDCLPCGSCPFDVFPVPGSHSLRRRPAAGYVPSQRFSRSQGLAPPGTCRPCFMPVPPLGLHPSRSFSTRRAVRPLERRCPPGVDVVSGCRLDHPGRLGYRVYLRRPWQSCRGDRATFHTPRFRALLPASVCFSGTID